MRTVLTRPVATAFVVACAAMLAPFVSARQLDSTSPPLATDIASLSTASDLILSPDGNHLVYALTTRTFDPDAKPSDTDTTGGWTVARQLWTVPTVGGAPRQLTFATDKPSLPRFSPDGSELGFIRSGTGGKSRIHIMSLAGGEPEPIDTGDLEPESFAWGPNGRSLAFVATPPLDDDAKRARWASGGATAVGEEWRSSALYTLERFGAEPPRRITGEFDHVVEFDWSPDGTKFAVISSRSADPYVAITQHAAKILDAATGEMLSPMSMVPQQLAEIRWSPDGRHVAFLAAGKLSVSQMRELMVFTPEERRGTNLVRDADLTMQGLAWAGDSASVIVHSFDRTRSTLLRVTVGRTPELQDTGFAGRVIDGPLVTDRMGRWLAFRSSSTTEPLDPTLFDPQRDILRTAVRLNPQVTQWTIGATEVVTWTNAEGQEIEGLLTVTPRTPAGPAPLMVMPHGGPDWVSTQRFSPWAAFFAARGFSVFQPNYRGGIGYGNDFYQANRGRLGEVELADIESGVDMLIATGRADPERLVYGGWSWGGYTTAWTIANTQRYKAAVVGAGVTDTIVQYATSDINRGHVAGWEFGGDPWRTPENFLRASPMQKVASITTPTLIIHGENDARVGHANAVLLHRALTDLGITTRFLSYPREPHGFTEPAHTAHMLGEWAAWYARFVK